MKILMKKRNFVKVEMEGLLGVKVPCLMPIRVKQPGLIIEGIEYARKLQKNTYLPTVPNESYHF